MTTDWHIDIFHRLSIWFIMAPKLSVARWPGAIIKSCRATMTLKKVIFCWARSGKEEFKVIMWWESTSNMPPNGAAPGYLHVDAKGKLSIGLAANSAIWNHVMSSINDKLPIMWYLTSYGGKCGYGHVMSHAKDRTQHLFLALYSDEWYRGCEWCDAKDKHPAWVGLAVIWSQMVQPCISHFVFGPLTFPIRATENQWLMILVARLGHHVIWLVWMP